MNINFYNFTPSQSTPEVPDIPDLAPGLSVVPTARPPQIVVVGQGGSVSALKATAGALPELLHAEVFVVDTVDPDFLSRIKKSLKPDAQIVCISKSGDTATVLEALSFFSNFPLAVITTPNSALWEYGHKVHAQVLEHPSLGGRFTGLSNVNLFPALLAGLPVEEIVSGGRAMLSTHGRLNTAWKYAEFLWAQEQSGHNQVLLASYSKELQSFAPYATQLIHETFAKDGKGVTLLCVEGPEFQHHTLQRFFGGADNMCLTLVTLGHFKTDHTIQFPTEVQSVPAHEKHLADWQNRSFGESMQAEFAAVKAEALKQNKPVAHIELPLLGPTQTGELLAFWQLTAIYGAYLRSVNPFDQPQVEASKNLALANRFSHFTS